MMAALGAAPLGPAAIPTGGASPVNLASARAYSDDAADAARKGAAVRRKKTREPLQRRALVERVGLEAGVGRRLRRTRELAELLLEHRRNRAAVDALEGEPPSDGEREEADVLTVCSFAAPVSLRALRDAQAAALLDCDRLEVPLGVVRGKLTPSLDPTAALQALSAIAQATSQRDKRAQPLQTTIDDAMAGLGLVTWRNFERLAGQLDALLTSLGLPPNHATETVTRRLLEQRAFRKQTLLGRERLRAEIEIDGSSHVLYLPASAAEQLPLVSSTTVVAIVELRPREDASESATESLLGHAVARVLGG
jgi:hypothetical protein